MKKKDRRRDRETTSKRPPESTKPKDRAQGERDSAAPTGKDRNLIGVERFPRKGDEE
jgi:hypothetical protein